jgi:hypothetical protein
MLAPPAPPVADAPPRLVPGPSVPVEPPAALVPPVPGLPPDPLGLPPVPIWPPPALVAPPVAVWPPLAAPFPPRLHPSVTASTKQAASIEVVTDARRNDVIVPISQGVQRRSSDRRHQRDRDVHDSQVGLPFNKAGGEAIVATAASPFLPNLLPSLASRIRSASVSCIPKFRGIFQP